jgi:hypothetical protein
VGYRSRFALAHEHLTGGGFDLPSIGPIFEEYIDSHGLGDRLRFYPGDFFEDPLPTADVLVMGHILHDWDLQEKRLLLEKAYEALPEGGALIVYEALIDDERRENTFGLLMSLNMLIETPAGFRLHRRGLLLLDARHRLPRDLRRAPRGPRLDGSGDQIVRSTLRRRTKPRRRSKPWQNNSKS